MSEPLTLDLLSWAKQGLTNVYTANTKAAFDAAFDAFVHQRVQVVMNGEQLTRDEYKKRLYNQRQRGPGSTASVKFDNNVVLNSTPRNALIEGNVGMFYVATMSTDIVVGAVTSAMNITVQSEDIIPITPGAPIQYNRRATVINQVSRTVDDM
ncbi:hypothetical protein WOLCODRAFT_152897 [Wolfiporia cocos MD-104 SS10]|uniref:Uncharacterized protein n=1 Tax=Wolfiporia cocos (strain MD-104) TaxID=742152 RepID=A0A2H3JKX0_WOLCO|nr:hypothetical protein WOLCODRAFT_152897 [Wolfiporia cocos MD-104 SS10]